LLRNGVITLYSDAIPLPSRLKCPEAKMKLPPAVSFHTEQRLMVWRPRGVLDEKMVNQITTFIGSQEATPKTPFDRFTDTMLLDAIDLSFDYLFHVALYRRMSYAGHPKVKSAFLVKWGKSDHEAKLHAFLTERSSLDVRLFEELEAAAKWLNVSAALLQPVEVVQKSPTST
jgi:hypothetical protein